MTSRFRLFLIAFILGISSACAPVHHTYVDPRYGRATYESLKRPAKPYKIKLVTEFQRNGEHFSPADDLLLRRVEQVVRASGLIIPVNEGACGELKITVNDSSDVGKAVAKGVTTGMTLGLVGSAVTDDYSMEATLSINGKEIRKSGYKHAIYSTHGLTSSAPEWMQSTTPDAAFEKVIEQLILNLLSDIQQGGNLTLKEPLPQDRNLRGRSPHLVGKYHRQALSLPFRLQLINSPSSPLAQVT
jgi:hypothetical protein